MPTWALLRRTLAIADERDRLGDATFTEALLGAGEYTNPIPGRFTHGYGVDPFRVGAELTDAGLHQVLLASTHGFASGLEEQLDALRTESPESYEAALRLLVSTAEEPGLLGTANHLLYLGRTAPGLARVASVDEPT
jgi:hypothetical protein